MQTQWAQEITGTMVSIPEMNFINFVIGIIAVPLILPSFYEVQHIGRTDGGVAHTTSPMCMLSLVALCQEPTGVGTMF